MFLILNIDTKLPLSSTVCKTTPLPVISKSVLGILKENPYTLSGDIVTSDTILKPPPLIFSVFVDKQRWWLFVLMVCLAAQFHRTAWVFLLVYPLFNRYYKLKTIAVLLILSIIGSVLLSKFLFTIIGNLGLGIISQKIEMYLELGADDNTMAFSTTTILIKGLLNRGILLALFFSLLNNVRQYNPTVNGLLNVYVLGTILYCATLPISISLARIAVYMDIVQIFLIPYILETQSKIGNRIILFGFISLYYLFRLYTSFTAYETAYTPFRTIFE